MQKIQYILIGIVIIALLFGLGLCLYIAGTRQLTTNETVMLGILLTVFSVLISWILTHLRGQSWALHLDRRCLRGCNTYITYITHMHALSKYPTHFYSLYAFFWPLSYHVGNCINTFIVIITSLHQIKNSGEDVHKYRMWDLQHAIKQ